MARSDGVTWPGLPRLLVDLGRVNVEDTTQADTEAAGITRQGISAASPVRTGYLAASAGVYGGDVTFALYGRFVDQGTSRMAAHPFVATGVASVISRVENVYAEHAEDAFDPVVGSHY